MGKVDDVIRTPLALAPRSFLLDLQADLLGRGIRSAVRDRSSEALFDWLVGLLQLQGISDRSAFAFSDAHGLPTYRGIDVALKVPRCPRLTSYWHFSGCGFLRTAGTCANPQALAACPVPSLPSRNGRLAQSALSLFLFIRDVCAGDLVGYLDKRLEVVDDESPAALRAAVLLPLASVYGVSNKVISMALADLLLAGDPGRKRWVAAGASMIAIDSLVHNYLHRTGALRASGAEHPYGPACYASDGCAELIDQAALSIDARALDARNPRFFPRLIQFAIWSFCTESGANICNGNQIDDRKPCEQLFCPVGTSCDRIALDPPLAIQAYLLDI